MYNKHAPKRGGGLLCPFRGELGPRLIQYGLSRGLLPYQVESSSIRQFGHNSLGSKIGWECGSAFFLEVAASPSNTKSHGPRPTSTPSGILVHSAVWPPRMLVRKLGLCLIGGGGSPSDTMSPGQIQTTAPSFTLIHSTVWPQYSNATDRTHRQTVVR